MRNRNPAFALLLGATLTISSLLLSAQVGQMRVADKIPMQAQPFPLGAVQLLDGPFKQAIDRKSTRLNSSHIQKSRMPSSA